MLSRRFVLEFLRARRSRSSTLDGESGGTGTGPFQILAALSYADFALPLDPLFLRFRCPPSDTHEGETAEEMQARVDGVIAKVRAIHKAAEDRGAEALANGKECSEKERRQAAEDADVVIISHGHFSRVFIACVPSTMHP